VIQASSRRFHAPSPGRAGGWRLVAGLLAALTAAAPGGCAGHPEKRLDGLLVVADGPVQLTQVDGRLEPIGGGPARARRVTAAAGRVVVQTAADEFLVCDPPDPGATTRAWRELSVDLPPGWSATGMDLSLDGRSLAIARGEPETDEQDLVTIDIETGAARIHRVELQLNGPPLWMSAETVVLEVIRPDQHSGIATVNTATGEVVVTRAEGIAPSVTGDGRRVAVAAGGAALIRVGDPADWLAGRELAEANLGSLPETGIDDIAIDADGARLAVVMTDPSGESSSVRIFRLVEAAWVMATTIEVPGEAAVSIDWLD
jgi:hypothetical protein